MEKTIKDLDIYISDGNYSSKYPRSEEFVEEGIPFIRGNNMVDGDISDDEMYYITPEKHAILLKGHVKAGDVLITTRGNIGQVAIVPERHEDSNINAQIVLLRTNPESLYNRYLLWALQSHRANEQYIALQTGTALKQLPVGKLEKLSIKVADIDEQHDMANTLDKVYEVIKERRKELLLLDDLIRARFVELFGNPITNDRGWEVAELNTVCDGIGDGLHGTPEYDEDGEYPFINGNNLMDGVIKVTPATKMVNEDTYKKHFIVLTDNTILLSINGTLGKLAFYNGEEVMLGKSACYCNLKPEINREFVYGVMKTDAFAGFLESNATASTIKNVGLKAIRGFKLILPPEEIQFKFIEFANQVDKSKLN